MLEATTFDFKSLPTYKHYITDSFLFYKTETMDKRSLE